MINLFYFVQMVFLLFVAAFFVFILWKDSKQKDSFLITLQQNHSEQLNVLRDIKNAIWGASSKKDEQPKNEKNTRQHE